MQTDMSIPDEDEFDLEAEMAEQYDDISDELISEKPAYTEEHTASQKLFVTDDDLEDVDELPNDAVVFDMSEPTAIDESFLKSTDLF